MTESATGIVEVNGAELYFERRGTGAPVVFISGGGGSGAMWRRAAELLADTYMVVTYDRRGNGRSPRPSGWTTTSVAEQAADCIALVRALQLDRPMIIGHSWGGTILVGLAQEHGGGIAGAVVVEPLLVAVAPSASKFLEESMQVMAPALAEGNLDKMWDSMSRWAFGDAAWDAVAAEFADEINAGNDTNATIDSPAFSAFEPDEAKVAACPAPIYAAYGAETGAPIEAVVEGARWVAEVSGGPLHVFPGGHLEGTINPERFVAALRPVLASMREPSAPRP